jgi:hypothetical protein
LAVPSLLQGVAEGVFGASNRVLDPSGRFFRGAFGLRLRIAGYLADDLFNGPFDLVSRTLDTIFVHIRSPTLLLINTRFGGLVAYKEGSSQFSR